MYIKRFESLVDQESYEECKDVIETLHESEEDFTFSKIEEGYWTGSRLESRLSDEDYKKAIKFSFFLKNSGSLEPLIREREKAIKDKSEIDSLIFTSQKAKNFHLKLSNYCSEVLLKVDNLYFTFILLFDNDSSVKSEAKNLRILNSVKKIFEDWRRSKTINVGMSDANPNSKHHSLWNQITEVDKEYRYGQIKFKIDIELENNIITIKPNSFKYKGYDPSWKSIKLSDISSILNFIDDRIDHYKSWSLKGISGIEKTKDSIIIKI